jgi:hypothetical protein
MSLTIQATMMRVDFNLPHEASDFDNKSANLREIERDLDTISSFLRLFKRVKNNSNLDPSQTLSNEVFCRTFRGVQDALNYVTKEAGSAMTDCQFPSWPKFYYLQSEVQELDNFFKDYNESKQAEHEMEQEIQRVRKRLISLPTSSGYQPKLIPECFQQAQKMIKTVKREQLASLPPNQSFNSYESWIAEVVNNTSLLPDEIGLESDWQSPLIIFCKGILTQNKEKTRHAYEKLPLDYRKHFDITQNKVLNFTLLLEKLKNDLLPGVIQEINRDFNDKEHFYQVVRELGCKRKLVAHWDQQWGKTNLLAYSNQVKNNPDLVVEALSIYDTHQINRTLFAIWRQLQLNINSSDPLTWPVCAKFLHTLKTQPQLLESAIGGRKSTIYQHSETSSSMQAMINELTIRASAYMSISSFAAKIPPCCPLIEQLQSEIQKTHQAILNFPYTLREEQKDNLEFARDFFLKLPIQAVTDKYNGAEVNYLIEVALTVLTNFFAKPDEFKADPETTQYLVKLMEGQPKNSNADQGISLKTSQGPTAFLSYPEEVAIRIKIAAQVGKAMSLPMPDPELVKYSPPNIQETLKQIATDLSSTKAMPDKRSFEVIKLQIDDLPQQFAADIKYSLGLSIEGTGKDCDCIDKAGQYLNAIPTLRPEKADGRYRDLARVIQNYLKSNEFFETNNRYNAQKFSFTGLLFPSFGAPPTPLHNIWRASSTPTTFKHMYCIYSFITANHYPDNVSHSMFVSKTEKSPFSLIDLNQHFSSAKPSLQGLPLSVPFSPLLIEILVKGGILRKVRQVLDCQTELAFGPLDAARERLTLIENTLTKFLEKKDKDKALTPRMLYDILFENENK